MNKRLWIMGLCLAALGVTAAGCDLYTEDSSDYYYCDDTGCYYCDDWGCYPDGGSQPGWTCTSDQDCAAGCFCGGTGTCEESGFCEADTDCAVGYVCDDRSTCVPDNPGPRGCYSDDQCPGDLVCNLDTGLCEEFVCTSDGQCDAGSYCDTLSGDCVVTNECAANADCAEGFECDESRSTCVPDDGICETQDDCGTDELCDTLTGECYVPECADITDELTCSTRVDCAPIYKGNNCTNPNNGDLCSEPGANCTCESFTFLSCTTAD